MHCYDPLMRICMRYKKRRDDAQSLLNEGFLKILLSLKSFDFDREFIPWASTLMVRTAIDDYRSYKSYNEQTTFKEQDEELEHAAHIEGKSQKVDEMTQEEVKELVFSLPELPRMVFNLFEFEGYKHYEVAELLNISQRSSRRYLQQAKSILRERLENNDDLKQVI